MDTSFLEHLGAESEAWALSNGLVMGAPSSSSSSSDSKDNNDHFFVHAPFSLYPSKVSWAARDLDTREAMGCPGAPVCGWGPSKCVY